jgi:ABC-type bacteriocin/lantibiotic exporter with double-glycine peptidase domain
MIIINVKPGVFSEHGHYAVLYGYTEEGFLVNDPYSADNSSRAWSYAELEDGIRNIWAFTAAATESEETTEAETVTEP